MSDVATIVVSIASIGFVVFSTIIIVAKPKLALRLIKRMSISDVVIRFFVVLVAVGAVIRLVN